MKKNIYLAGFAIILAMTFLVGTSTFAAVDSSATSTDEYTSAKSLMNQNISCQQLSSDQLDNIGDYFMEQMMPGQAHKNMDQMLGGEGSDSLKQMHILMARRWYCGDAVGLGMMGMMVGPGYAQNLGSNYNYMMENLGYGYGMMGNYWGGGGWLFMTAATVLFIVAIAALIKYLLKK